MRTSRPARSSRTGGRCSVDNGSRSNAEPAESAERCCSARSAGSALIVVTYAGGFSESCTSARSATHAVSVRNVRGTHADALKTVRLEQTGFEIVPPTLWPHREQDAFA